MATCQCGVELTGRRRKCDACKSRPGTVSPPVAPDLEARQELNRRAPEGLHDRGQALWSALGVKLDTVAGQIGLEACRIADRLDELDRIIHGKGVLNLMRFRVGSDWANEELRTVEVTVTFDGVLTEARQQQSTFAKLLGELDGATAAPLPAPRASTPLDELKKRRDAK